MSNLIVFALNEPSDLRHTHLTRAHGEEPGLPPLAAWLGVDEVDTNEIELFPLADLEAMALSDYIAMAFAPEAITDAARSRLDALEGSVLLVPEAAVDRPPQPGAALTLVAELALTQPDHSAALPKAETSPLPHPTPEPTPRTPERRSLTLILMALALVLFSLLALVL